MKTFGKDKRGFTLIELLLYISLVGIILLSVSIFIVVILESRVRNQSINEVEGNARQIVQIILQTIRNAEAINSPVLGASSPSLSLDVLTEANDPTVFDLSGGTIRIKEGLAPEIALTSNLVTASELSFQNLSRADTPGIIRIQFTLNYLNPNNREEFEYSKTFYASAALRYP